MITKNLVTEITMINMMIKSMRWLDRDKQIVFNEQYDEEQYATDWTLENLEILFFVAFFQSYRDMFLSI